MRRIPRPAPSLVVSVENTQRLGAAAGVVRTPRPVENERTVRGNQVVPVRIALVSATHQLLVVRTLYQYRTPLGHGRSACIYRPQGPAHCGRFAAPARPPSRDDADTYLGRAGLRFLANHSSRSFWRAVGCLAGRSSARSAVCSTLQPDHSRKAWYVQSHRCFSKSSMQSRM